MAKDPAPAGAVGPAFRQALASLEDLVRRESSPKSATASVHGRREEVVAAFARLSKPGP